MPANSKVHVIGCSHEAQSLNPIAQAQAEAGRLVAKFHEVLSDAHDVFLAEETKQGQTSKLGQLAHEAGHKYLNVDVPIEAQELIRHIPPTEIDEVSEEVIDNLCINKYAKAWNLVREYHIYKCFAQELLLAKGTAILVCGQLHMKPIAKLLESDSYSVAVHHVYNASI